MLASVTGQLLEWYEWSVYAVFAPFIAVSLFNPENPTSAMLSTFGVFAIGFLFRPLGGVVFGRIADAKGRRFVLVTTMLLMAAGSILIGLTPTFETIGLAASALLLLARIVQGFAHGGESATANSYIAEIAPADRRGLWGSSVFMTVFGGAFIAFIVGGVITGSLAEADVQAWGWRIPFLLGALLAIVALYLRIGMVESDVFEDDAAESAQPAETAALDAAEAHSGSADRSPEPASGEADRRPATGHRPTSDHGRPAEDFSERTLAPLPTGLGILLIFLLVSGVAASNYTWTSYVSTYAIQQEGMSANGAYWAVVAALAVGLAALPFWGWVSDRVGRKPVLVVFTGGVIVTQFPLMALIDSRPWTLFVAGALALIVLASGAGLLAAVMAETFPTKVRTSHIGLAYSLATAVFGGTTPYVNQLAVAQGVPWASNAFIVFAAALALWAVTRLPERRAIDLRIVR